MNEQITLICTPLKFYTDNDEALCFEWIEKIKSIKRQRRYLNKPFFYAVTREVIRFI